MKKDETKPCGKKDEIKPNNIDKRGSDYYANCIHIFLNSIWITVGISLLVFYLCGLNIVLVIVTGVILFFIAMYFQFKARKKLLREH